MFTLGPLWHWDGPAVALTLVVLSPPFVSHCVSGLRVQPSQGRSALNHGCTIADSRLRLFVSNRALTSSSSRTGQGLSIPVPLDWSLQDRVVIRPASYQKFTFFVLMSHDLGLRARGEDCASFWFESRRGDWVGAFIFVIRTGGCKRALSRWMHACTPGT